MSTTTEPCPYCEGTGTTRSAARTAPGGYTKSEVEQIVAGVRTHLATTAAAESATS